MIAEIGVHGDVEFRAGAYQGSRAGNLQSPAMQSLVKERTNKSAQQQAESREQRSPKSRDSGNARQR